MDERVGSFLADEDGVLRPNLEDEAMRKREEIRNLGQLEIEEVIADGERGSQIPCIGQDRDDL
jgi:hypothetical protein